MAELDPEIVRHGLQVARAQGLYEIHLSSGDSEFTAKLGPATKKKLSPSAHALADVPTPTEAEIVAPLVGYFRNRMGALEVGKAVEKGEIVGIISALGIANDVETSVSGEILEILVEDGAPVDFGQVIARVKL